MNKTDEKESALVRTSLTALARTGSQDLARRGLHDLEVAGQDARGDKCCPDDQARLLFCLDHQCSHDKCPNVLHLDFALIPIERAVKLPRIIPHLWTGPDDVAGGFPPGCSFCGESDPAQYGKPCPKRSCSTWYEVLSIPESTDEDQIETAYRELAKKWDPEQLQTPDEILFDGGYSETQLKWFDAAYAVLGNPVTRQQYDAELRRRREHR